jgi:hypothetical protein
MPVSISTNFVGFEVLTAVVMNVAIFWKIVPCSAQRYIPTLQAYRVSRLL